MEKFVADPAILNAKGEQILNQGQQFGQNVADIFKAVNEMVNSNYLSPEAVAIAHKIESYKDDLNRMTNIINQYGNFCKNAGNKVVRNQEDIVSGIN